MAAGINSGILYLENFIDSVNTLPSDFGRLLSYIRSLDDKCTELLSTTQSQADVLLADLGSCDYMTPEQEEQRRKLELLQVDLIHYAEEKLAIAQLAENMLTYYLEQLDGSIGKLKDDIELHAPMEPAPSGLYRDASGRSAGGAGGGFPDFNLSGALETIIDIPQPALPPPRMPAAPARPQKHKTVARKSDQNMAMGMAHPSQLGIKAESTRHHHPAAMMPAATGNPAYGAMGKPGYSHAPALVHTFTPVLPQLKASATSPQAPGKTLTKHDVNANLINKQAELLWPDDGLWYLIQITAVDVSARTIDIVYLSGETEHAMKVDDIVAKGEMSIIHTKW